MQQTTALLNSIAALLGAVVWPAVVVVIAYMFGGALRNIFLRSDELALTAPGGIGLVAKRKEAEARDALVDASASKSTPGERLSREDALAEVRDTRQQLKRVGNPLILWVDDRPSNNRYERGAMEALGMTFVLSAATDDALSKLSSTRFDLVISDMGRPPDPSAGYTLLDALRQRGDETPLIFYATSGRADHFDESVRRGALGCTNQPRDLIRMVLSAIKMRAAVAG